MINPNKMGNSGPAGENDGIADEYSPFDLEEAKAYTLFTEAVIAAGQKLGRDLTDEEHDALYYKFFPEDSEVATESESVSSEKAGHKNEPYDQSLYESRSAWLAANRIDDSKIASAASDAIDGRGDRFFRNASQRIKNNENLSWHQALCMEVALSGVGSAGHEPEDAWGALETFERMSILDTVGNEEDFHIGLAKGILKHNEFAREDQSILEKSQSSNELSFAKAKLEYLDGVLNEYLSLRERGLKQDLSLYLKDIQGRVLARDRMPQKSPKVEALEDALTTLAEIYSDHNGDNGRILEYYRGNRPNL